MFLPLTRPLAATLSRKGRGYVVARPERYSGVPSPIAGEGQDEGRDA